MGNLRKEIPEMSACMTELSTRWKALGDKSKQSYLAKERLDRERYQRETAAADAEKLAQQDLNRKALTAKAGEAASSRGARGKMDLAREKKEARRLQRQADMDPDELEERHRVRDEKRAEADERRRVREEQEAAVAERHTKLDKDATKKANQRLEYLLKQSDIFAKFTGGAKLPAAVEKDKDKNKKPASSTKKGKAHHRDEAAKVEEDVEEFEEEENHVFLTKQPACIEFGQLKGYQLEGLNWMIHLAEKGLNGILADEMGKFYIFKCTS